MRCFALLCVMGFMLGAAMVPGKAETRSFRLSAPEDLEATGFLKYLLPRFSLKTSIRIEIVAADEVADVRFSAAEEGTPVFSGLGKTWFMDVADTGNEHVARFKDWLTGDIGRNTIDAFQPDGKALFTAALEEAEETGPVVISGDVSEGERLSVIHCGRCHMVNEQTRFTTIGSTPSFAVMRSFADWQARFEAFFALNPHPAFTVIEGVTEPFDITRPPPIVPVKMSLADLDAILAFVSRIPPADLGPPIQYE
ncbi:hypothetical protein [Roseibium salinum]|uniref:Cytochrome c domain-containing protein n=1 Tax=Roseibium salinum TaxID=1604349 RepID=A0ABT3R8V2_9HYPH|nr:hypothetical protein [Roseibium sp. DSM 29163]MCX2725539.1 hypothetical protein [Roseibium sp. DSM 29163]